MKGFVLDASAILAYLSDESGKEFVAQALYAGINNAVNIAEVVSKLRDKGLTEQATCIRKSWHRKIATKWAFCAEQ